MKLPHYCPKILIKIISLIVTLELDNFSKESFAKERPEKCPKFHKSDWKKNCWLSSQINGGFQDLLPLGCVIWDKLLIFSES